MIGVGDNVIAQFTWARGAMEYPASGDNSGGLALANSSTSTRAFAASFDGIVDGTGLLHQTSGWSVTGGFEHHWNPAWKTSLYGAYGNMQYDAVASGVIATGAGGAAGATGLGTAAAVGAAGSAN